MKTLLRIVGGTGLALLILPPVILIPAALLTAAVVLCGPALDRIPS